jgi:NAD(P)-dependent dehydrogenase (short-subunit alcohol dehydrogenase family)
MSDARTPLDGDALDDTLDGTLDGKVALVTGASRGIGEAIARRFAAAGAAVAVTARTVEEGDHKLLPGSNATTVQEIVDAGGTAVAIAANLADPEQRRGLVAEVERQLGPIDVLVNNAAVTYYEPVETFSERHYDTMFAVQVRAPFELAQLVLPGMTERGRGWILNISSAAGRHPQGPPYPGRRMRGGTVYGMCKAALERFTTGLAAEVHASGIAVNVLSPSGLVGTPGVEYHGLTRGVPEAMIEKADDFADVALWLCVGDPAERTGRICYSRELRAEIAGAAPA